MKLIVRKTGYLCGQVTPPGSKSQSIRAIILASLCQGESTVTNLLCADDTQDAMRVVKQLGAIITKSDDVIRIKSTGLPLKTETDLMDSGNSGIATHFVMPILGLRQNAHQPIVLNCGPQMRARPIQSLVAALNNLGLHIQYLENDQRLPICISGALIGGTACVEGMTSQYLSALLFALPCAQRDSVITVKNLAERSYVEMTLNYLRNQGIQFQHFATEEMDTYQIQGRQQYKSFCATIPSDFSSASYLIAAAVLIPGEVILHGLDMAQPQGDKQLITLLQKMGADIVVEPGCLRIRGGKKLTGIKIDAGDIPDLLPTLAVIGTYATGKTEIYNAAHARIKETDRIHAMTEGLRSMGAKIEEKNDGLIVSQSKLRGCAVKGYDDHRTVMALAVAGMIADEATLIDESEAINKTFPSFVNIMQTLGADMEVKNAIFV